MEDDVDFCEDFKSKLETCLLELPEDWDAIHLGGWSPANSNRAYSLNLDRCNRSWGAYGYIINSKVIPILLNLISGEVTQVDTYYASIMSDLKWFKTKEMLVYHLPGYSEINMEFRDIKELYK